MERHKIKSCELLYSAGIESIDELCNSDNHHIHLKTQKSLKDLPS